MLDNIEDAVVQFCRTAFKGKYRNLWIDVVRYDKRYLSFVDDFFPEVIVDLYPKLTNVTKELQRRGIEKPKNRLEWEKYKSFVWEIVHGDILKNQAKGGICYKWVLCEYNN